MQLPRIQVDLHGRTTSAQTQQTGALRPGELSLLLSYDDGDVPFGHPSIERVLPLEEGRYAVGRRNATHGTCWRIVDAEAAPRLGHPAWLWTEDEWFDTEADPDADGRIPPVLPLRAQLPNSVSFAGRRKRTIKTLAATVAALRKALNDNGGRPVAVRVTPQALHAKDRPARWFILALLTSLPPAARARLRIGVGELAPDPGLFDLIVTSSTPNGFSIIDAADPPNEGDDLAAYYIRNRLHANDPEAVEAAAFLTAEGDDPWGEGVARLLRDAIPGVTSVSDEMLKSTPEGAVRALVARLRAGADVDAALMTQLIKVTLDTRDPRPWLPMLNRPATVRAKSVQALLRHAKKFRPKQDLVRVLGLIYPRGADLTLWVPALLGWIKTGRSVGRSVDVLQQTLLDWPTSTIKATRASIWSEVVHAFIKRGAYDAACRAVVSPLSREMCRDGASEAVVGNWVAIPVDGRNPKYLAELVDLLLMSSAGELATMRLYEQLADDPSQTSLIIHEWCRAFGTNRVDDPLFRMTRDTPALDYWVEAAIARRTPEHIREMLSDAGPGDRIWVRAEAAQGRLFGGDAHARFIAMANLTPGHQALEPVALGVVHAALDGAQFPDFALSEVARLFINVQGGSPLWPWITITATRPGNFDDATIDATVVDFCESPPPLEEERKLAATCARYLGASSGCEPMDHARWVVRMAMAPDSGIGFNDALEVALIEGIAARADAREHMAGISKAMLSLPNEHPALGRFLNELVPIWQDLVG